MSQRLGESIRECLDSEPIRTLYAGANVESRASGSGRIQSECAPSSATRADVVGAGKGQSEKAFRRAQKPILYRGLSAGHLFTTTPYWNRDARPRFESVSLHEDFAEALLRECVPCCRKLSRVVNGTYQHPEPLRSGFRSHMRVESTFTQYARNCLRFLPAYGGDLQICLARLGSNGDGAGRLLRPRSLRLRVFRALVLCRRLPLGFGLR